MRQAQLTFDVGHQCERRPIIASPDTNLLLQCMLLDRTRDWFGATATHADESLRRGEQPAIRDMLEQTLNTYSQYEQFAIWTIIQQASELLADKPIVKEALTRYRVRDDRIAQAQPQAQEQSIPLPNPLYQGTLGRTSARSPRAEDQ